LQKLNSYDNADLFKALNLFEFAKDVDRQSTIRSSAASDDEKDNSESMVLSNETMIINDVIKTKKFGKLPLSLHKVVPLNWIPNKYFNEIACARLFELMVKLCKLMLARPGGSRKELE
jgi:hypothetical protein